MCVCVWLCVYVYVSVCMTRTSVSQMAWCAWVEEEGGGGSSISAEGWPHQADKRVAHTHELMSI